MIEGVDTELEVSDGDTDDDNAIRNTLYMCAYIKGCGTVLAVIEDDVLEDTGIVLMLNFFDISLGVDWTLKRTPNSYSLMSLSLMAMEKLDHPTRDKLMT